MNLAELHQQESGIFILCQSFHKQNLFSVLRNLGYPNILVQGLPWPRGFLGEIITSVTHFSNRWPCWSQEGCWKSLLEVSPSLNHSTILWLKLCWRKCNRVQVPIWSPITRLRVSMSNQYESTGEEDI